MVESLQRNIPTFGEFQVVYKRNPKVKQRDLPQIKTSLAFFEQILKAMEGHEEILFTKEVFMAFYLSRANRILKVSVISVGSVNAAVVDKGQILREATLCNASCFVVWHNHPSGQIRPSNNDIKVSNELKEAARYCDLVLLDSLIVDPELKNFTSLADEGVL